MKVNSESEVAQLCPTLATPWTAAYQAPPSMGFSRQEYWSGLPLPSPSYKLGPLIYVTKVYIPAQHSCVDLNKLFKFSLSLHLYGGACED